jgi:hypothetical protein
MPQKGKFVAFRVFVAEVFALLTDVTQLKYTVHGEQGATFPFLIILRRILSRRDSFGTKSEGFAQDEHGCCAAPNHFLLFL